MTRIQDGSPGDIEELTIFFIEQGQKLFRPLSFDNRNVDKMTLPK